MANLNNNQIAGLAGLGLGIAGNITDVFLTIDTINEQMDINRQLYRKELKTIEENAKLQAFVLNQKLQTLQGDYLAAAAASGVTGESVNVLAQSMALQTAFNINIVEKSVKNKKEMAKLRQQELEKQADAAKRQAIIKGISGAAQSIGNILLLV